MIQQATIEEIKIVAEGYHELGISIIPFFINPQADSNGVHDKTPIITTYKNWQTTPQTDEEFKNLNWKGCNGFGVILGTKAKNGLYLACIDHDTKNNFKNPEDREAYEKAIPIGKAILKKFPQATKIETTVNEGLHYYYWSKTQPEIDGNFHDTAALELLGYPKLCVMYPSYGYRNIGSDLTDIVENLDELFHKILKENGFGVTEEAEVENQVDNYSFQISKIIDLSQLEDKGNGQYQGRHPTHDSTTEHNFTVDTKKNAWYCFRHCSGGGALTWLAVKENIIKCEQAKRGALRGKKFQTVLKLAVASGLINEKVLQQSEINPVILAKDIMEDHVFVVDRETDELHYYVDSGKDEGIYSNQIDQLIRREIVTRLDENFKTRYQNEIKEFILGTAPLVVMGISNPDLIAVQNGVLDIRTKTITAHNSQNYLLNKLQVEFKTTESHVWHDFIEQVIPNPTQRKQVQELIGHCLYGKISSETCLILLGGGSNGKTIFLTIITKFLGGSTNVGSHSIQALCYDKFVIGEIRGKLANICADLPHKELMNTSNFKALTSGDSVESYIKHVQKTISFLPTAKYIFSANQIPPVTGEEDCYAWYRRFIFADFTVTFTKKNSKPRQELLDSLSTPEVLSEILNWAVEGFDILMTEGKGDVTDKPSVEEIRLRYLRNTDSALAFFVDKVESTNNSTDYLFIDEFFRSYVNYCVDNNKKPKTQGDFINTVKKHLPGAEKTRIRPDKNATSALSAFRYIKLKTFVPTVLTVPTFKTIRAESEKNTLDEKLFSEGIVQKPSTPSTPSTKTDDDEGYDSDYDRDEEPNSEEGF